MGTTSPAASLPSERRAYSVGLTGGIGSGKSAAADRFAALGAAIVDSDAIARSLTAPGGVAVGAIAREFGAQYIGADGALDRARMRERVFHDPSAKSVLEAILHPRIRAIAQAQAAEAASWAPYVVFVVPLLVESGTWRCQIDRLLVVDCSAAAQERRVCARSGLDSALARAIIAQQASRQARLDAADDVLVNEGSMRQLEPRIERLHRLYYEFARSVPGGL